VRIEYLESGSVDCPLLAITAVSSKQLISLHSAFGSLGAGAVDRVLIHELPGTHAEGGVQLVAVLGRSSLGVRKQNRESLFKWIGDTEQWRMVSELVEPLLRNSDGFQWLEQGRGSISIILAPAGRW